MYKLNAARLALGIKQKSNRCGCVWSLDTVTSANYAHVDPTSAYIMVLSVCMWAHAAPGARRALVKHRCHQQSHFPT